MTRNTKSIISHVRQSDKIIQTNDEHQQGVAQRAESFAAEFGMGDCGRVMGLLHDKGKEQEEWQKYIKGITGLNKEYAQVNGQDHLHPHLFTAAGKGDRGSAGGTVVLDIRTLRHNNIRT